MSIIDEKPLAAASERKIFHNEMEGRRSSAGPVPTVKHAGSRGEDNPFGGILEVGYGGICPLLADGFPPNPDLPPP